MKPAAAIDARSRQVRLRPDDLREASLLDVAPADVRVVRPACLPRGAPVYVLVYGGCLFLLIDRGASVVVREIRIDHTEAFGRGRRTWFVCPDSEGGCGARRRELIIDLDKAEVGCVFCIRRRRRHHQGGRAYERLTPKRDPIP
jgi:hypothetical protein